MLEQLRAWLNGSREYYAGLALFAEAKGDPDVLTVLKKGPTQFSTPRLQSELLTICNNLKAKENDEPSSVSPLPATITEAKKVQQEAVSEDRRETINPQLYEACRQEAGKAFKTAMNDRAILFSLATMDSFEDCNTPDKVASRAKLAQSVVKGYQAASLLYDCADYVKMHGHLPNASEETTQENYDHLPDDLVYQSLSNLRKNYNKMKKREQTPERIAMQQKHEVDIKKLEARWRLLKGG